MIKELKNEDVAKCLSVGRIQRHVTQGLEEQLVLSTAFIKHLEGTLMGFMKRKKIEGEREDKKGVNIYYFILILTINS